MNATDSILTTLNAYDGDNIWQDVIYDLDVDQDTTDALDPSGRSDVIALTDGRVFRHDGIEWTEEPGEYAIRWEVRDQPDDDWGRPITYATATLARWNATEDMWSVIDTDGFSIERHPFNMENIQARMTALHDLIGNCFAASVTDYARTTWDA